VHTLSVIARARRKRKAADGHGDRSRASKFKQEFAMSNNGYSHGYKTGLNGGKVNTNGMTSQQKQSTDAGVNAGNAARGSKK